MWHWSPLTLYSCKLLYIPLHIWLINPSFPTFKYPFEPFTRPCILTTWCITSLNICLLCTLILLPLCLYNFLYMNTLSLWGLLWSSLPGLSSYSCPPPAYLLSFSRLTNPLVMLSSVFSLSSCSQALGEHKATDCTSSRKKSPTMQKVSVQAMAAYGRVTMWYV